MYSLSKCQITLAIVLSMFVSVSFAATKCAYPTIPAGHCGEATISVKNFSSSNLTVAGSVPCGLKVNSTVAASRDGSPTTQTFSGGIDLIDGCGHGVSFVVMGDDGNHCMYTFDATSGGVKNFKYQSNGLCCYINTGEWQVIKNMKPGDMNSFRFKLNMPIVVTDTGSSAETPCLTNFTP